MAGPIPYPGTCQSYTNCGRFLACPQAEGMAGNNDYTDEDARLRRVFERSTGRTSARDVQAATGCNAFDAWRVAILREVAAPELLDEWLREAISVRKLWRIATDAPSCSKTQLALLKSKRKGGRLPEALRTKKVAAQ